MVHKYNLYNIIIIDHQHSLHLQSEAVILPNKHLFLPEEHPHTVILIVPLGVGSSSVMCVTENEFYTFHLWLTGLGNYGLNSVMLLCNCYTMSIGKLERRMCCNKAPKIGGNLSAL